MYIRDLIPRNFAELAEAVPIDKEDHWILCARIGYSVGAKFVDLVPWDHKITASLAYGQDKQIFEQKS